MGDGAPGDDHGNGTMNGPPLFVCPVRRAGQRGPVAPWITMAGWTQAAAARHGEAWMLTVEGVLDAPEALERATTPASPAGAAPADGWRRHVPEPLITLAKDVRRIGQNLAFDGALDRTRWRGRSVPYVFQLHGLFWDAGLRLARDVGAPSVLVVDACQVAEARSWGVRRPGWSRAAERWGEAPQLRRADLVVCVSDEVADSVARVTGRRDGVIVVPNGVDTELFTPDREHDAPERVDELGSEPAFVVGWAGSFRTFHGLEVLVDAAAILRHRIPEVTLLLVGDGLGRPALEDAVRTANVRAIFPGTVRYPAMPRYLRSMDVAVALAPGAEFHYSPVKLREYQACAVPVVAADAGEMSRLGADGDTVLRVAPGDAGALARAIERLYDDRGAARAMAQRGHDLVVRTGSWDERLGVVEAALGLR
jgi:glycosyltransferase involved in cell wall biosynthesis